MTIFYINIGKKPNFQQMYIYNIIYKLKIQKNLKKNFIKNNYKTHFLIYKIEKFIYNFIKIPKIVIII